jgi:Tfp pilus assembly protein PilO
MQLRKRRKIIVAGLALLALVALIYLFDSLSQSTQQFNEALYLKQVKLAKYRQKVLEKKAVKRELLNLQRAFKRAEAALLTGKTQSLAAAELQEIVSRITKAAGGQIMTVRILQPDRSDKDMYLAIPLEVTINSTMRQLTELLNELDRSAKLVRITELGIRSRKGSSRFARGGKRAARVISENIVTTTLTVEGFAKKMET